MVCKNKIKRKSNPGMAMGGQKASRRCPSAHHSWRRLSLRVRMCVCGSLRINGLLHHVPHRALMWRVDIQHSMRLAVAASSIHPWALEQHSMPAFVLFPRVNHFTRPNCSDCPATAARQFTRTSRSAAKVGQIKMAAVPFSPHLTSLS